MTPSRAECVTTPFGVECVCDDVIPDEAQCAAIRNPLSGEWVRHGRTLRMTEERP